jgi:hypothetical protein
VAEDDGAALDRYGSRPPRTKGAQGFRDGLTGRVGADRAGAGAPRPKSPERRQDGGRERDEAEFRGTCAIQCLVNALAIDIDGPNAHHL